MTKRIIKLASVVTVLCLLSACGQKGPLYMPPERETTDIEEERTMTLPDVAEQTVLTPPDDRLSLLLAG